jgi:Taurine catabolism dioxygenase TauD, TfdA family
MRPGDVTLRELDQELDSCGFVRVAGPLPTSDDADEVSNTLVDACRRRRGLAPLSVVGTFVLAPMDSRETRNFQTLHFDFGLPVDPKTEQEVARFTALYVPVDAREVQAVTRLVPLAALLGQRSWPRPAELVARLTSYGRTHGAWDDALGYVEGSFARIIEGVTAWRTPLLPSVKQEPGFLCGLEFDCLAAEVAFFAGNGLRLDDVEVSVALQPGELLVFDNLAVAHGRRGTRQPGELQQRMFGQVLQPPALRKLRDDVLKAFDGGKVKGSRARSSVSTSAMLARSSGRSNATATG